MTAKNPVRTEAMAAALVRKAAEDKAARERAEKAKYLRSVKAVLSAIKTKGVYWPGG